MTPKDLEKYDEKFGKIEGTDNYVNAISGMNFNYFQIKTRTTAIYKGKGSFKGLQYAVLGLCGESGEVAEKLKKIMRDKDDVISDDDRESLKKELGDILWYIGAVASELGISFSDLAETNVEKVLGRKARNVLGGSGDNR